MLRIAGLVLLLSTVPASAGVDLDAFLKRIFAGPGGLALVTDYGSTPIVDPDDEPEENPAPYPVPPDTTPRPPSGPSKPNSHS